ncbi:MAG: PAS domain S-box protein [Chloroflexi bacterium]|nr:PAS domain S-box protein [Chloroflexota bacterium]
MGFAICHLYDSPAERWPAAVAFLRQGLDDEQRVAVLTEDPDAFRRVLAETAAARAGQAQAGILWLAPGDLFPAGPSPRALAGLGGQGQIRGSPPGVRLLIDTTWLVNHPGILAQWPGILSAATRPFLHDPAGVLCQYDRALFSPAVSLHFLKSHRLVLVENEACDNPYFELHNESASPAGAGPVLERCLQWLRQRQRSEDILSQNELYFRTLYDLAPLAYQSLDAAGRILTVNQAWCELLKYSKEEVTGTYFGDYVVPSQREAFQQRFSRFKAQGEVLGVEFEIVRKTGETVIISAVGRIAYDAHHQFKQTHCILTNITERKQTERVYHESRQIYKALFENNYEVILLIDPQSGAIVAANQAACAYYGYNLGEISRMLISQINTLPLDEILAQISRASTREQNVFAFQHRLASGEVRDVEVFCGPIEINGVLLLHSIVHDVTLQKAAEAEAGRLNSAIRERLVALTQPVGQTHHLEFEDLFNLEDIQRIQDAFAAATRVASIITDVHGRPITRPSGFSRLCNDIIRQTPAGLRNCMLSDASIGQPNESGPTIQPCLSCGLLDAGASITVGDHHIANWLVGQVLDPAADRREILHYAGEIGADATEFASALEEINTISRRQFEKIAQALYLIAAQLSKLAIQNVQQARTIVEREQANTKLVRVNHLYRVVSTISQAAIKAHNPEELYQTACKVLVADGKFEMAWIGLLGPSNRVIYPVFSAGENREYFESRPFRVDLAPEEQCPISRAVDAQRLFFCNDLETYPGMAVWKQTALKYGYRSAASFPLKAHQAMIGGLMVYSSEVDFFDDEEIRLLEEVSTTLTFALDAMEAEQSRKRTEQALLASEERYRRLFSSSNDAIFVIPVLEGGQPGNFIEANPVACQRLGYRLEQLLHMSLEQVNVPENASRVAGMFAHLLRNRQVMGEATHLTRDGRRIPVEINASLFELNGRQYALSIVRDITDRKQAEARIQNQLRRLSALHSIDTAINTRQPLPDLLDLVLEQVVEHLGVNAADILLYDPAGKELHLGQSRGFPEAGAAGGGVPLGAGIAGQVGARQALLHVPDLALEPRFTRPGLVKGEAFRAYYGAPLVSKGRLLGVLEVFYRPGLETDEEWVRYFITLSGQAAIAIEDAHLDASLVRANQVLSQAYDETIEGWARALDLRDHETEGHSRRVADLSTRLGKVMGLSEEELVHVYRGALLHDIGKMSLPDQILLKKDDLTEEEWQVMRLHPQHAYTMLSSISFLRPSLDIPYCHHEKWDGSGYPRGLKGTDIPLAARIFAVVDVWDALLSDRPYRPGWPQAEVEAYLRQQSGQHFEPRIVEAFLHLDQL